MKMSRDELEYAISQYLDGILPPLERAALDDRLAGDAEARALLDEYRQLDASLKNLPMPALAWDHVAEQIRQAVAQEETPIRHYELRPMRWVSGLAIAASVLLAISLAMHFAQQPTQKPAGVATISGPAAEVAAGPVVSQIGIGPSPAVAANWQASDEIISRPTVVLIDQARSSAQDSESGLY
jgi:anti-sigma-K factor RskA